MPSIKAEAGEQDSPRLDSIRGWLLLFCLALIPHTVESAIILARSWPAASAAGFALTATSVAGLRMMTEGVTFLGQGVGILLIITRNRYAPAFFTLFFPFGALLMFADPDLAATLVVNNDALGLGTVTHAQMARQVVGRELLNLGAVVLLVGYWLRSERVRRVFGSNGLGVFTRARRVVPI